MRKPKAQPNKPLTSNIEHFLDAYDPVSLQGAINSLENSVGWELMKSYLYFQAASYAGYACHLSQKTGNACEAAGAGAKAEVLREMADNFVEGLRKKVMGNEGVVESEIPEE